MYRFKHKIELKKNQTGGVIVKYANFTHLLKLRWTLYKGHRLVLLMTYRNNTNQYLLKDNNYNQDSVRFYLTNVAIGYNVAPYIILQFKKFDYTAHKAVLLLYMFDKTDMVRLKFLK